MRRLIKTVSTIIPNRMGLYIKIGFFTLGLILQSILIPLLPIPGKVLLDRFQKEDFSQGSSFLQTFLKQFESIETSSLLIYASATIVVLGFLFALLRYLEGATAANINLQIFIYFRERLNRLILSSTLPFLNSKRKMDLVGRVSTDVDKIQQVFSGAFAIVFRSIPTIVLTIVAMFLTNAKVATIFVVSIPALYFSTFYITRLLKKKNRLLREASNSYQESLLETYSNFSILKSLQSEKRAIDYLNRSHQTLMNVFVGSEKVASLFYGSLILVQAVIRALVLVVGFYFILEGQISLGDFFLFFSYLEALIHPIDDISRFSSKWTKTLVAIERVNGLIDELEVSQETSGQQSVLEKNPSLKFMETEFSYSQESRTLFKDLDIELKGPGLFALVGDSGTGKSTLMSLINRLYDPNQGKILYSNQNIYDIQLDQLRKDIVYIGQDNFLIKGSILENLKFAKTDIDEKQAWEALEKVNADIFVNTFPDKIDTLIGESGQGLSGGQTRRLCLARSFLKSEAQVFLFDEPTAGLDERSARVVLQSILKLAEKALVIYSTHRIWEVKYAEKVLLLNGQNLMEFESMDKLEKFHSQLSLSSE